MKNIRVMLGVLLISAALTWPALSAGSDKALKWLNPSDLTTLLHSAIVASTDYVYVYDASLDNVTKVLPGPGIVGSTATAAELNYLDVTTAGTIEASKAVIVDSNKDASSFRNLGLSGTLTDTRAPTADSATTNNAFTAAFTTPVDTTGTNTHNAYNVSPTISNATGGTNTFNGYNLGAVTGDAQVDVTGVRIGTGTRLGTSNAIVISTGWDKGLDITNSAAADSAATEMGIDLNLTTPVDTTGTNTHYGLNIDTTIGNASGGTNVATAVNIANVTGDAQVTETGVAIGTGFDTGLSVGSPVSITSTVTGDGGDAMVGFLQSQVASTTTGITIAQCGATFVSNSADVMQLPEASTALGCRYTFVCGTADDFDINPQDSPDQIGSISTTNGSIAVVTLAPSAGDAIRCTDIGSAITLEAVGADLWVQVAGGNGIWTDAN